MGRSPAVVLAAAWAPLALVAVLSASQKPASPQFRAGVEVVAVDVSVVDREGRPVADLKPGDFSLNVDGNPRRLVSAEFVSLAARSTPARAVVPTRPGADDLSDGFTSNEGAKPGRLIVLAIDQGHLQPSSVPGAISAASRFVASLSPSDQVALIAFPQGGPNIAFTTRHEQIQKALNSVAGRATPARSHSRLSIGEALTFQGWGDRAMAGDLWSMVVERVCSVEGRPGTREYAVCAQMLPAEALSLASYELQTTATTLGALTGVVEHLAEIDGPKTLVLLSEGLVVGGTRVGQDSAIASTSELGRAAFRARVSLYVLQLDRAFLDAFSVEYGSPPVSAFAEDQAHSAGLETLAGAARGAMFKITAAADRAFQRVATETSAYYLLAFEPEPEDRDGEVHRIRVRVERPNVSVRSRTEFAIRSTPKPARTAQEEVKELLQSPVLAPGLPMRVGTFTMRDTTTQKLRMVMATDIGRGVTAPADITLGYSILNDAGAQVGGSVTAEKVKPYGVGEDACWKHAMVVLVDPGDFTVKVAAVDPEGRRGSVEHRVSVGIRRAGGAQMSDLLLLDPAGEGPDGSNPAISGTVTTNAVTMYLEVYSDQVAGAGKATASFEVAGTASGTPMFSKQGGVLARPDEQRWIAADTVALPLLPPGDYVARVQFALDGRTVAQATRLFHLALRMGAGAEAASAASVPRAPTAFRDAGTFVRPFVRESVLAPDVLRYFLRRMDEIGGVAAAAPVKAAIVHAEAGAFGDVIKDLEGANAELLAVPFLRGLAKFAAGELNAALQEFRAALKVSSEFLPAAFYLGACYAAGGWDRDAAGAWKTALITESAVPIVYDVLVDALIRLRDTAAAQAIIDEAREKWPEDDLFVPRMAATHALAGRTAEALTALAGYIERHPADPQALFLALRLLFEAHAAGRAVRSDAEDRSVLARYAKLYAATDGANQEIVSRWLKFVESRKRYMGDHDSESRGTGRISS